MGASKLRCGLSRKRIQKRMGFAKPTPPDAAFVQSETVAHRGLLGSQRYHWIHPGGAARRNETRRGGNESEQTRDNDINRRIERIDLEQDVLERGGSDDADEQRDATRTSY